ncbi:hypothetical protein IL306_010612 [Fusarium sp. DS 682]|nr:hypothetical protein IL306_010612 [Fusarium sp. DS 682]
MQFNKTGCRLVALAALIVKCTSFTVTSGSATDFANGMISGPGLSLVNVPNQIAPAGSVGTFSNGPFGIGSGGIVTTGAASGADGGSLQVDNGGGSQTDFCGGTGYTNALAIVAQLQLDTGYNGITVEFIFATEESESGNADNIGIFFNGFTPQYASDASGNRITAQNAFLELPDGIFPPDSLTAYSRSSPPLVVNIPATPGSGNYIGFWICDFSDALNDSGMLVKVRACENCDFSANGAQINYVKTTTTIPFGDQPYTSTIKASGTVSGTFIFGIPNTAEPTTTTTTEAVTTTTTAEPTTTTTEDEITTTTAEATSTTKELITTTAEPTITTTADVLTPTTEESTAITTEELATTIEESTTTADETTTAEEEFTTTLESIIPTAEESTTASSDTTSESTTSILISESTTTTEESSTSSDIEQSTSVEIDVGTTSAAEPSSTTASETESVSTSDAPIIASGTTTVIESTIEPTTTKTSPRIPYH